MQKTIIIIGAGIAGLSAGCYAQMNDYKSIIFELHDLPGGLCTAWERKEYIFDGCIHYLFGTAPGQPFHQVWEELGALQGREIIHHEELMQVVGADGRILKAYCDPDRLAAQWKDLSPQDANLIEDFAEGIRQFTQFDMSVLQMKPRSLMGADDWLEFNKKVLPFAVPAARWGLLSARELANRFQDPFLRQAIPHLFGWEEIPVMAGMAMLAYMHLKNAGFPSGASLEFARAIEKRYIELGGEIQYKAQVQKILLETDMLGESKAVGVRLYDDSEHFADTVISAADGRTTIFDLLDGRFVNPKVRRLYNGRMPIHTQLQVSLGVNRDMSGEPHWTTYLLPEPLQIAGEEHNQIGVKHYCFDPSLAPAGKSVIETMLPTKYSYWQHIYGRRLYDTEQDQVADVIAGFLDKLYPGIQSQIEVIDVATPLSYERYTGNWMGSTCGWLLTKQTMRMMIEGMGKTLPGLSQFYLAGQWVEPGGSVPIAAMSGRNVIQLVCAADGQEFTAQSPQGGPAA
jgi:phytoene dehydrogenase-like protein